MFIPKVKVNSPDLSGVKSTGFVLSGEVAGDIEVTEDYMFAARGGLVSVEVGNFCFPSQRSISLPQRLRPAGAGD